MRLSAGVDDKVGVVREVLELRCTSGRRHRANGSGGVRFVDEGWQVRQAREGREKERPE